MDSKLSIEKRIASVTTDEEWTALASDAYAYQLKHNAPFATFVHHVGGESVLDPQQPLFLPIEAFKHSRVSCEATEEVVFKSSGTTGTVRSTHPVFDTDLYRNLSVLHFEQRYGPLKDWVVLALLPSYVENGESSLVYMVDQFIRAAAPGSGYVLHQPDVLRQKLLALRTDRQRTLLIGVSYALLDFAEQSSLDFPELTVMETGGMKGRRKEITREELHAVIRGGFPSSAIHSEYGMTELLSQGYMGADGRFHLPPWAKAYVTEASDPFHVLPAGRRGLLAFIDLANFHSCAFVQTRDIGVVYPDGSFTVEGRLDHSDLRGCNLLYT